MRFVRTILAFAIAVSLAMLPLGASAGAGAAMPSDEMQTTMPTTDHGGMAMDECCPDDMKAPTSHPDSKCGMGFCCVGGALALGDVRSAALTVFAATATKIVIPADQVLSYRGGSPPFRPPRS